jgi:hypothetical protein
MQGIDTAGDEPQLVYSCAGMVVPSDNAPAAGEASLEGAAAAAAPGEAFGGSLHSRPEAPNKIW